MLALVDKPPNISSFTFVNLIKKSLNKQNFIIQKIGFLGTLDPFACGQLTIACNSYTKLLEHIKYDFKKYKATLFLGLESKSLDIQNISSLKIIKPFNQNKLLDSIKNLKGKIKYFPPKFSAKHINGTRAYKLALKNAEFNTNESIMNIKKIEIENYNHPFLSFEIILSSGGYVRSVAEIMSKNLNVNASLCYLKRTAERLDSKKWISFSDSINHKIIEIKISYAGVEHKIKLKILNIKDIIKYDHICLKNHTKQAINGAKIFLDKSLIKNSLLLNKLYLADFIDFYSIIEIGENGEIKYILNRIYKDVNFIT